MNKVGIVTINDNNNYGNRLQNYALQEALIELGVNPVSLENYWITGDKKRYLYRRIKYWNFDKHYSDNFRRKQSFANFNKLIKYSDKIITPFDKLDQYEFVIVGSDQVWNPYFGANDITLLSNVAPEKRIAFAASFGVDSVPKSKERKYRRELSKYKAISVREDAGQQIVHRLSGKEASIVIDPTMLLSIEKWRKVENEIEIIKDCRYIFSYFLGNSEKHKAYVKSLSQQYNMRIVDPLNPEQDEAYSMGPSEFLAAISNASLVTTDSFHATVFSILYKRPFIVFDREGNGENMSSRMATLLNSFELNQRFVDALDYNCVFSCDFSNSESILQKKKEIANQFLRDSLDL